MILSRAKPAIAPANGEGTAGGAQTSKTKQLPKLEEFLSQRDYTGAMSLLEFNRNSGASYTDGPNSKMLQELKLTPFCLRCFCFTMFKDDI